MSPEKELDLELLESSLRQQESARQNFSRDLKVAVVLILGFQFVIFFRFIDLNDQMKSNEKQIQSLQDAQVALNDVQAPLEDLKTVLQKGERELGERLKSVPSGLRAQIVEFENELGQLRHPPAAGLTPAPRPMVQMPVQSPAPAKTFLVGLSDADVKILVNSDFGHTDFESVIQQIVEHRIIQPAFGALNVDKERLLEKPYSAKKAQLLAALKSHDHVLQNYDLKPDQIAETVNQVQTQLNLLRFTPPRSDHWWKTFEGKARTSRDLVINTEHAGDQIGQELRSQQLSLQSVGFQLTSLLQEGQAKKEQMAGEMQKVQNTYKLVQDRLQTYAKPLSVIAVGAREAVLYYPIILTTLFVYFAGRYLLLRWRARHLVANYRELGVSNEVLLVSVGDFAGVDGAHGPYAHFMNWLVLISCLVPGVLTAISLHRILNSADLLKDAPLFLYKTAGGLYVISYLALVVVFLRPTLKFRHRP